MKRQFLWPLVVICCVAGVSLILASGQRLWGQTVSVAADVTANSPAYVFQLKIGGTVVGEYTECSGLGSNSDILENTTTNAAGTPVIKAAPGTLHWQDITLKRTGLNDTFVWSWRQDLVNGNTSQIYRYGSVVMTEAGSSEPVAQWDFTRGWPASLTFDRGVEQLVIVHEGLQRITPAKMPPIR